MGLCLEAQVKMPSGGSKESLDIGLGLLRQNTTASCGPMDDKIQDSTSIDYRPLYVGQMEIMIAFCRKSWKRSKPCKQKSKKRKRKVRRADLWPHSPYQASLINCPPFFDCGARAELLENLPYWRFEACCLWLQTWSSWHFAPWLEHGWEWGSACLQGGVPIHAWQWQAVATKSELLAEQSLMQQKMQAIAKMEEDALLQELDLQARLQTSVLQRLN